LSVTPQLKRGDEGSLGGNHYRALGAAVGDDLRGKSLRS
jgi:hypothetical protein